jgi:hypothetical protein
MINNELEDRLSADLRGLAGDTEVRPNLPAIAAGARRLRRRGLAMRTAGVAVIAGATALGVGLATTGTAATGVTHSEAAAQPSAYTLAGYTVSAMAKATTSGGLYMNTTVTSGIKEIVYNNPALQQTEWVKQNTAGATIAVMGERLDGATPGLRVLDYAHHTVLDSADPLRGVDPNPATALAQGLKENILFSQGKSSDAKQVNRVVGTQVVDGQQAYEVVMSAPDGTEATTIWLSKATSLPLKQTSPGVSITYQWGVPTTQGPASLWPDVPAGFTVKTADLNTVGGTYKSAH